VGGAVDVLVNAPVTARFSEAMSAASITAGSFELRDSSNTLVPATISYDALSATATLTPTTLLYGGSYTATLESGASGVKDAAGVPLATDYSWTFTAEPPPPPVLVLGSSANPFSTYASEILLAEGTNAFATADIGGVTAPFLDYFDVIVLGDVALTAGQVTMLSNWVQAGGNLIAFSPDPQLAGLLGIASAGGTLANAYLLVDSSTAVGSGITAATMQFHGTADRYTLNGATSLATLYSNATTATTNPAATLRSVGANGGQAAAFTFDLARSIVYTRQGNPAWAGQDRDGVFPVRPDDLFFGARAGDIQPDWVDTNKLPIPQADEQQRFLVNLIEAMVADRGPIPRFWYLPRGLKAAIVMTGDDHSLGGTAGRFNQYLSLSTPGCVVADWQCVRATSYLFPSSPLTNAQAASYVAQGFEVALHASPTGSLTCSDWTPASLETTFTNQLASFEAKYTSVPVSRTERTHCVAWSDWVTHAQVEAGHGIRLDTNYYHYPDTWIGTKPGFMTGSGFPMRFATTAGATVDVYQAHTFMTDESGQPYPSTVNTLLDRALGPEGYYGAFVVNAHTDQATSAVSDAVVASAQARNVPIISAKQLLDWIDGRNASRFRTFSWNGSALAFTIEVGAGANGLQAMLPRQANGKTLANLTRGGSPVATTTQTLKGIQYAVFAAGAGAYTATYS
jgi:hypothetical protein